MPARAARSDEVAQVRGSLQQARVDVASLERTEKALEQLVTKHAATQDELAQNQAALAKAPLAGAGTRAEEGSAGPKAASTAESADLMATQAQEQVQGARRKSYARQTWSLRWTGRSIRCPCAPGIT